MGLVGSHLGSHHYASLDHAIGTLPGDALAVADEHSIVYTCSCRAYAEVYRFGSAALLTPVHTGG